MPSSPRNLPDRPGTLRQALEQAGLALARGRPDEAERLAAGVLTSDRGNLDAARLLGTARLMQGRAEAALEVLERAARRSEDPSLETLLARALSTLGRADEALEALARATSRRPPLPQAFLELGDQMAAAGRFDAAQAAFEAGLALAPEAQVLRVGLAHLWLRRNDAVRARDLFAEVRAAAPERHDALVGLASATAQAGDPAAAAELYRQVLTVRPDDAATRLELGRCLLELGRREAGEAALRAAAQTSEALAGPAILALAATPHGRFFLRPSDARRFLKA
jgi:tetratricopeptide (TPR) repeat protein